MMPKHEGAWRPMRSADLAAIRAIAAIVHPDFPEDDAIFAERLALWPDGCFVLSDGDRIRGYCLSHPWRRRSVPALNTLLMALPRDAADYYLHDLALLPDARSSGAAGKLVSLVVDRARQDGFARIALVAVNGSEGFWARQGFSVQHEPGLNLGSYAGDARYMVRNLHGD